MRCCAAGDLTQLQLLCVNGCLLRSLPASLARLQRLEMLHMKGVPWIDAENVNIFTRDDFLDFVAKKRLQPYFKHIKQVKLLQIFLKSCASSQACCFCRGDDSGISNYRVMIDLYQ